MAYTRYIQNETTVDGTVVSYKLKRIKRKTMSELSYLFVEKENSDEKVVQFKDKIELIDTAAKVLPEYVVEFKGLIDDDGKELSFDDIKDEMCFGALISDMFAQLINSHALSGEELKK